MPVTVWKDGKAYEDVEVPGGRRQIHERIALGPINEDRWGVMSRSGVVRTSMADAEAKARSGVDVQGFDGSVGHRTTDKPSLFGGREYTAIIRQMYMRYDFQRLLEGRGSLTGCGPYTIHRAFFRMFGSSAGAASVASELVGVPFPSGMGSEPLMGFRDPATLPSPLRTFSTPPDTATDVDVDVTDLVDISGPGVEWMSNHTPTRSAFGSNVDLITGWNVALVIQVTRFCSDDVFFGERPRYGWGIVL